MSRSGRKKILVIAESIDVEDSSGSKANVALIQNLADAGFAVEVYHYTRKEVKLPGIPCFAIKEKKLNVLFLLSRVQRKLQHGFQINLAKYLEPKFGFSFTFLNDSRSISESIENLKYSPDLVLTLSKGASFRPHHALIASPDLHSKWLAYIHDPYPFHFYPAPYTWSEPGFAQKADFFRKVAEKCRWVAYPSLLLQEWMQNKYPLFRGKGIVIPHQLREPDSSPSALPEFFDPKKFNLLHAGNLMKQRPPFYLIEAYQKFLERNPGAAQDSCLLLVGHAAYHQAELTEFADKIPQLFVSKNSIPFEEVQEIQKLASVNIILESIAEGSPFLPGKFPHCIAAERPILLLGPEKSESRRLLGEEYKYWSELDEVDKISHLIQELYFQWQKDPQELVLKRKDLQNYLSKENLTQVMEKILGE